MNYKHITETFVLMDNKHGKSISIQNGADLCQKCTEMRLAVGLRPDPLGELIRSPDPIAALRACF